MIADVVYLGGKVCTMDGERRFVEAVGVRDGRFCYVGDDVGAQAFVGEGTVVVDLAGQMVTPGLHDMHIHGVFGTLKKLFNCNFPLTSTHLDIVSFVAEFAEARPDEAWIVGGSWLMGIAEHIDRRLLDAVCPDRPVFLWDASFHNVWVNSRALEIAGIDGETPDPEGGVIVRDGDGVATGLLIETAVKLVFQCVPDRSEAEYDAAVVWLAEMMNGVGVTSIKEAAVNRPMMAAYKRANDAGTLNLRVGCHFLWLTPFVYDEADLEPLLMDRHLYAGDRVKVDFLKLFLDGVPVARTACMLDPYVGDDPATHDPYALMLVDREVLKDVLVRFDAEGLVVKMHATGDASLRACLDAIEAARVANGDSGLGHEIAHPQNVHPDDLGRFAELGAVPDLCPILWHPSVNKEVAVKAAVGAERNERSWPIGSYVRSGAKPIGGTDWPAMAPTASSWPGIQTLVTRADPSGQVPGTLGVDEGVDVETALSFYTVNGAVAMGNSAETGSIEVGKLADFIVIDRDIFEVEPEEIGGTVVLRTVVEGVVVFDRMGEKS